MGRRIHAAVGFAIAIVLFFISRPHVPDLEAQSNRSAANEAIDVQLPLAEKSTRFAIIGDNGNASRAEYEVAAEMERYRETVHFDFVLMLGDNLYGGKSTVDYRNKFELPYKSLLENGVHFFASLGNHDAPSESLYKPFNMDGHRYYSFKKGNVTFFALDSTYMDTAQRDWLSGELERSHSTWKICYFHHPLYSNARHGPDLDLREELEPLFERYNVNVVLSGHEHVYERLLPQHGIQYFVLGNSGELRYHDLHPSSLMAKGFDTDRAFGLFEADGNELSFQIVSRTGRTIDSGTLASAERNP
jgi:predicted MPP superfamily phosphohydrolase